jgi:hypothetical protein
VDEPIMPEQDASKVVYSARVKALFAGGLGALGLALALAIISLVTPSAVIRQSGAVLFLLGAIGFAASLTFARAEKREQLNA